jgi:Mg/Co/Ni transporter MgtE
MLWLVTRRLAEFPEEHVVEVLGRALPANAAAVLNYAEFRDMAARVLLLMDTEQSNQITELLKYDPWTSR